MGKSVAVIGAGVAGLVATKEALAHGLNPTCFEQRDEIGGIWYVRDPATEEVYTAAHVYEGLITNTTNHWYTYSDYDYKPDTPPMPAARFVKEYLEGYADEFKLRSHLRLRHKIIKLDHAKSYEKDGKWLVTYKNLDTGLSETEEFEAVFVASGYISKAVWPNLPGKETFNGSLIHAGQYYSMMEYKDKRVSIVGSGISAIDIACILAPLAKQVTIVSRNGVHIIPRWLRPGAKSYEWLFNDRKLIEPTSTRFISEENLKKKWEEFLGEQYDFGSLGLAPSKPIFTNCFAINSNIDTFIYAGQVQYTSEEMAKVVRGEVEEVVDTGLKVKGRAETVEADKIIVATGYSLELPFLHDTNIMPEKTSEMDWWMYFYPVHQKHPTLFGIGIAKVEGAFPAVAELSARAACGIVSGDLKVPPKEEMLKRIGEEKAEIIRLTGAFPGYLNTVPYALELAKFIGCYPDIDEISKRSEILGHWVREMPITPHHYRLLGPHSDFEAAKARVLRLRDPQLSQDPFCLARVQQGSNNPASA